MIKGVYSSENITVVGPLGLMLLICVLVLQFVAPAVAAPFQAPAPEHHMTMDHSNMVHSGADGMDHDMSEMDTNHQGADHCMSFMCCFQESSSPFKLIASDVLVPSDKGIEPATILPSHSRSAKDRPPQYT